MGQIQAHASNSIHDIVLKNSEDQIIGSINVTGFFHNTESWDHLKDEDSGIAGVRAKAPAGPHNRRIIKTLQSVRFSKTLRETNQNQDNDNIQNILDHLSTHKGLKLDDKSILNVDSFDFPNEFTKFVKSIYSYIAEFKD